MRGLEPKIGRSGNPFVDWGLSIAAAMAGADSAEQLTTSDLVRLVKTEGMNIARLHQKLNSFYQVFGSNTSLHNPKNRPPDDDHVREYVASVLEPLASYIDKSNGSSLCGACGQRNGMPPTVVARDFLGRDWFPLAGAQTEANLMSAASRSISFCPVCLLAVRLIPSAVMLVNGKIALLQSAPPEFAEWFARETFEHARSRWDLEDFGTLGQGEGTKALTRRLLAVFQKLERDSSASRVDSKTRLFAWYFSNTGQEKPQKEETAWFEEIPNPALLFLRDVVARGLKTEVEQLLKSEKKETDDRPGLLRCAIEGRDYGPLYPKGKYAGASVGLFEFYQTQILKRSPQALKTACMLAERTLGTISKKTEREALCKPDGLRDPGAKSRLRRAMVEMALEGRFSLREYRSLFFPRAQPDAEEPWRNVDHTAWNVIRYYLNLASRTPTEPLGAGTAANPGVADSGESLGPAGEDILTHTSEQMLSRLLARRSSDAVRAILLTSATPAWLKNQYLLCARNHEGFTYERWLRLAFDRSGRQSPWEWLFQTRLHMAFQLANGFNPGPEDTAPEVSTGVFDGSGLPEGVTFEIGSYLSWYLRERGAKRLTKDVLSRWARGEIGLGWLEARLRKATLAEEEVVSPLDRWFQELPPEVLATTKYQVSIGVVNAARRMMAQAASHT